VPHPARSWPRSLPTASAHASRAPGTRGDKPERGYEATRGDKHGGEGRAVAEIQAVAEDKENEALFGAWSPWARMGLPERPNIMVEPLSRAPR
jgi:hypothetical protein